MLVEQLDTCPVRIVEDDRIAQPRRDVATRLAGNPALFQRDGCAGDIETRIDMQRQRDAPLVRAAFEHDRLLAHGRRQDGAIFAAIHDIESDERGIMIDLAVDIGGLERDMSESPHWYQNLLLLAPR